MSAFSIDVVGDWLGGTADAVDATFGSLRIVAGGIPLTEVDDTIAKATRSTIRVPAVLVAEWLAARWWRLRWECAPQHPDRAWRIAHSMAGIDSEIPWPPLEIAGDGEFVQVVMHEEPAADVAAIRYLRAERVDVPALEFDSAVDRFLSSIDGRVGLAAPHDTCFHDVLEELRAERADPTVAQRCRWQARAGIDPGDADDGWTKGIERVAKEAGAASTEDILAGTGPASTPKDIETLLVALKRANTTLDLGGVRNVSVPEKRGSVAPWKRGASAARRARAALGIATGPVSNDLFGELLGLHLPVSTIDPTVHGVSGGLREDPLGVARVLVPNPRPQSQRFQFARLLGLAIDLGADQRVLPVTDATTATQKFGRAFAQEFLCPWAELDAFTDENGTGEEAIASAAERWGVSEMLITTTLVNRQKLERGHLARFDD